MTAWNGSLLMLLFQALRFLRLLLPGLRYLQKRLAVRRLFHRLGDTPAFDGVLVGGASVRPTEFVGILSEAIQS